MGKLNYEKVLREKLLENAFSVISNSEKDFADWIDRAKNQSERCDELFAELEKYKKLEEHGLLFRLPAPLNGVDCFNLSENEIWQRVPCKIGDTVYRISDNFHVRNKYIEKTTISRIAIDESGIYVFCSCKPNVKRIFGIHVFLTREEAEAKLKEMEGENEQI